MCGIQPAECPVKSECGALTVGAKMTVGFPKAIALLQDLSPLCVHRYVEQGIYPLDWACGPDFDVQGGERG
jgi:hypothetical protein